MYKGQLHWKPILIIFCLAMIWGAQMALIKIAAKEITPLFMSGIRSLVASTCLLVWLLIKRVPLFPSKAILLHGIMTGLLFGLEFALIYVGLQHTMASRTYVLLYIAPFFVALEAHFFLKGDRLNSWKIIGLILAFAGIVSLFIRDFGGFSLRTILGDLMIIAAGLAWGSTTVYVKKFLAHRTVPLQSLFYQVFFSAPFLFLLSAFLEKDVVTGLSPVTLFSVFYQCIMVAFIGYLVWYELIHRYPVSLLHGFSFLTPVIGVFLSGAIIMGEVIRPEMVLALILVSAGLLLLNKHPGKQGR